MSEDTLSIVEEKKEDKTEVLPDGNVYLSKHAKAAIKIIALNNDMSFADAIDYSIALARGWSKFFASMSVHQRHNISNLHPLKKGTDIQHQLKYE